MSGKDLKNNADGLVPFLKWVGGKRWLASNDAVGFPRTFNQYIEPFLGGGAVFFHLTPARAILADLNRDLIDVYKVIRDDWYALQKALQTHHKAHCKDYYYDIRNQLPNSSLKRAARFIYLNRTCWNGLYRVNLKGEFNVPIGTKTSVIFDHDDFENIAKLLKKAMLVAQDFEKTISKARRGDFVFVDPPYTVKHNFNNFRKYNENIFSWADQERLRDSLYQAKERGAKIVLCNADTEFVRDLYRDFGEIRQFSRYSVLAADASMRKRTTELVIRAGTI